MCPTPKLVKATPWRIFYTSNTRTSKAKEYEQERLKLEQALAEAEGLQTGNIMQNERGNYQVTYPYIFNQKKTSVSSKTVGIYGRT